MKKTAKKTTVTINGTEYKVKNTLRAIFIFEQIAEKKFEIKTLLDNYVYLYSIILANNPDGPLSWETFIDAIDNDPEIARDIDDLVSESIKVEKAMQPEGSDEGGEEGEKKN